MIARRGCLLGRAAHLAGASAPVLSYSSAGGTPAPDTPKLGARCADGRPRSSLLTARLASAFALVLAGVLPSAAHDAPSGWAYDPTCCSNQDCQPVPSSMVTATPDGWLIDIPPGVHKTAPQGFSALVPWDSPRLRHAPDGLFHPCIGAVSQALYCLYVPDMGA